MTSGESVCDAVIRALDVLDGNIIGLEQEGPAEKSLIGDLVFVKEGQWIVVGVDCQWLVARLEIALELL